MYVFYLPTIIANDIATLQDRFADFRATPTVDPQQDWTLLGAEEENGYTIVEFTRKLVTCDDRDLDVRVERLHDTQRNSVCFEVSRTQTFPSAHSVSHILIREIP